MKGWGARALVFWVCTSTAHILEFWKKTAGRSVLHKESQSVQDMQALRGSTTVRKFQLLAKLEEALLWISMYRHTQNLRNWDK